MFPIHLYCYSYQQYGMGISLFTMYFQCFWHFILFVMQSWQCIGCIWLTQLVMLIDLKLLVVYPLVCVLSYFDTTCGQGYILFGSLTWV